MTWSACAAMGIGRSLNSMRTAAFASARPSRPEADSLPCAQPTHLSPGIRALRHAVRGGTPDLHGEPFRTRMYILDPSGQPVEELEQHVHLDFLTVGSNASCCAPTYRTTMPVSGHASARGIRR